MNSYLILGAFLIPVSDRDFSYVGFPIFACKLNTQAKVCLAKMGADC